MAPVALERSIGFALGGFPLVRAPFFEVALDELAICARACKLRPRRVDLRRALVVRELGPQLLVARTLELVPPARDERVGRCPLAGGA